MPGTSVGLVLTGTGGADGPVAVDVLFLLDATGSMGDEIDRLKTSIDSVAAQVAQLQSEPDVRFGMTLYRDLGDQFVTSTFDFTASVTDFREALADVVADGGDDYPEALDEGLAEALRTQLATPPARCSWSSWWPTRRRRSGARSRPHTRSRSPTRSNAA